MNSKGSTYNYLPRVLIFLSCSSFLIIFTTAQEEDIETCPIGQKTFAYDDGETICIPDTFCISPQVVVDLDNRQYGCVDKCDNDEYFDVSEDHSTVSCVIHCSELKTYTTLPSGLMKCVDSCPYGQFRFRRRDGSYVCQTHCTGFEKALEFDDGTIECVVNNCQDPTPVLQLKQSSSSGYQCITVAECMLPQTTYTFDDITKVCVDPCPSDHFLINIGQAQPMCYTNPVSPNPYCTSGQFININRNNQIECVENCTGNKIPRRFDNGTVICVNSCPMNQQQIALEDKTYICIEQCNIGETNKYDENTKIFSCVLRESCETQIFERFEMDSGDLICIQKCSGEQIHVDVGTDIPVCRNKCSGSQPYFNVDFITKTQSCINECPDGKIHADYGNGIIKCVERCPESKFIFRKDDSSAVCISKCQDDKIPLDLKNENLFPVCQVNNCTNPALSYIDLTSTSYWNCISSDTCSNRQSGNRYPTHIEQFEQWSYDKCVDQELSTAYDQGSNYYYIDGNSSLPLPDCGFNFPCKTLNSTNYAHSKINESAGHLVFLKGSFIQYLIVCINTTSSQQRLFISYPIGSDNQFSINMTQDAIFYIYKGWTIFKTITFRVNDNYLNSNYIIILEGDYAKLDLANCAFGDITSANIDRGLVRCMNQGTLNIDTLTVNPINMTKDPLIYICNTSGMVYINNSFFEGINRLKGSGAVIECYLNRYFGGITIYSNSTFINCKSKYSFIQESQPMEYDIGAVYIFIPEGEYHQFDLRGAIFRTSGSPYIGKGLFIETDNLAEVMRRSDVGTKYGIIDLNPQINEIYMMGIESTYKWLTIPLQYTVNNVINGIYHINNLNTTSWNYLDGKGNDNDYCGWVRFPCATFGKAVIRSIAQHPEINSEVKIGIVQGYILNTITQIDANGRKVSISNQLDYQDESTGTYQIQMYVRGNGQYCFSNGTFSVSNCSIVDQGIASTTKYMILMQYNSKSLEIKQCTYTTDSSEQTATHGLIEINGGSVNIEQINVNNVKMSECNFIKLNYGTGYVNISSSTFTGISSVTSNGAVIFGEVNISCLGIRLSNLTFTECIRSGTTDIAYGSIIQLYTLGVGVDINSVQFTQCSGLNGGGMFARLDQSSSVKFSNNSKFESCTDNSQSGGGLYLNINEYSSCELNNVIFNNCKAQQFGGGLFGTVSSGGVLTIMNTTTFTSCSCVGSGKYQEGGGINIIIKDGNSKFLINDSSSFTSCTCKDLGGAFNINGSLDALINIKSVSFISCSSEGGGGLNTRLQSGAILNITDAVNFIECTSTSSNGGGIRAILTEPASSLYISGSSTFDQCKTSGQGGGIYINANQSKIININTVLFDNCEAIQRGGAISSLLVNGGSLTVEGLTNFSTCKTSGDTEADEDLGGGAVYANVSHASSKFRIIGTVKFDQCESTFKGGAIYIKAEMSQLIEINKASLDRCTSTKEGGGIYAYITNGGSFRITNGTTFTQCKSISGSGGGLYAIVKTTTSEIQITDGVTFDGCESEKQGGGIYISAEQCKINEINKLIVTGCKAKLEGSGLYIEIIQSAFLSISNETSFTNCASQSTTSSGGGMYAIIKDIDSRLVLSDQIKFENCNSSFFGGGISFLIQGRGSVELIGTLIQNCISPKGAGIFALLESGAQLSIINSNQFKNCVATGNEGLGGGIYADIGDNCKLRIHNGALFDQCTSYEQGGGAYLIAKDRGIVDMNKVTFQKCSSTSGGAIFTSIQKSASLIITNQSFFKDCEASTGNGGGIYATIKDIDSKIIIQDQSIFDTCQSVIGFGGAAYIESQLNTSIIINRVQFDNCNAFDGGAIQISLLTGSTFTITNESLFKTCSSTQSTSGGGGINANIESFSKFIISSNVQFDTCTCTNGKGGAVYFIVKDKGTVEVNQALFKTCSSINGGGLYASLDNSSSLTVTNSNLFIGCTTSSGSGGGLYTQVKDPDSKLFIEDNSYFFECNSLQGQGGAGFIEASNFSSIKINKAKIENCSSIQGGGIYCNIKTGAQLQVTNSSLFQGCNSSQSGGGFYAIIDGANSKLNISGFTQFDSCSTTGPTGQGGGSYLKISNNASFELNKVTYKGCSAFEGGGMYGEIDNANRFILTSSNQFINCSSTERGGAMYLNLPNNTTFNFIIGSLTLFKENTAGECGRDIFFHCNTFNFLDISHRLLFDLFSPLYDLDNAFYGTEHWTQTELSREPEVDYELIKRYSSYFADTLYISSLGQTGNDEESCGKLGVACSSFSYARDKVLTPEWKPQTIQNITDKTPKVIHTYVAVGQIKLLEPLTSEANELILRGATHDEVDSISVGYHSKVQFGNKGQIICSDLAQWQEEENQFSDVNGVDQKFTLEQLDFVIPEQMEGKSLILVKSSPSNLNRGREVEVLILNCKVSQEPNLIKGVYSVLFKSEPYLSIREKIIFDNVVSNPDLPDERIYLNNGSLIEINYEPGMIPKYNYLQFKNCFFKYVKSTISAWNIRETPGEQLNQVPYGAGSVLTIRNTNSIYLHLHFMDCTFECCELNMQVKTTEQKQLGIGGVLGIYANNVQLVLEHFRFVDLYIGLAGNKAEGRYQTKQKYAKYLKENGDTSVDINPAIDSMNKPIITLDSCVIKTCKSFIVNSGRGIRVIQSGGVIVHTDRIGAKIDFKSSIFDSCLSSLSQINSPSNIADVNSPFEPLWDRELRIGKDGGGLIVTHGAIKPYVKGKGIQFINQINDNFVIHLKKGQFSTRNIQLQRTKLYLKGEGESLSSIMQKEQSQHLFTLQDSQLDASEMRAELWGASASLIQCNGFGTSIISRLRVSGCNSEFGITSEAVFEVILGTLILIDVKVEKVIMIQNENERNSDINKKNKILGLITMKENAKLLRLEKCIISNISIYNKGSIILMNGGLNSKLEVKDCNFIQSNAPWSGSAIRYIPTNYGQTLDIDGAIFQGFTADTQYNSQGGAIYIDMKQFDVAIQFRRCVFAQNSALNGGTNIFIAYKQSSQRARRDSFLGCYACAYSSIDQEKSFCYTIGNDNEVFIDERDSLQSSCFRQQSYDSVCLKVEVIQFCEGIYNTPQITVPSSQASSINIVGCNRSNAGLILSEVRVSGLVVSQPPSSTFEPKYLFHSAGIVYLEDVIIENIFLKTGSIILAEQMRKSTEQASAGIEWLGLRQSGIYGCYFSEITTNENKMISIQDLKQSNQTKNLQINTDSQSFIIHDSIFSSCISFVNVLDTETKGGILNIMSDGIKVDIISCEFRRCKVIGRNMIYIGWTGEDSNDSAIKTVMISDTIFTECSSVIPGMRVVAQSIYNPQKYLLMLETNTNEQYAEQSKLYSDENTTYDEVYKHGLIYLESLTEGDKSGISSSQYDIYGIFVAGCHSAVGSGLTATKVTLQITESTFITPMCYSNIIYLNQTRGKIQSCYFKGRNSTYHDPTLQNDFEEAVDDIWTFCPGQSSYYSTTTHGLIYLTKGSYEIENDQFEQSQVGAVKIDTADVVMNNVSFIESKLGDEALYDGGQNLVVCIGKSRLEVVDASINGYNEDNCSYRTNLMEEYFGMQKNDNSGCTLNILKDGLCQMRVTYKWELPQAPTVVLEKVKLVINLKDEEEPFKFELEGNNFVPLVFTIMIDQLRLKTKDEIHEEVQKNKDEKNKYEQNNTLFDLIQTMQHRIVNKIEFDENRNKIIHFTNQQQENSYKSNGVDYPRDSDGRIVWPPKDATQVPFLVLASVHGTKRASFSMKDISWLDSRTSYYGILASNDGNSFTGENGVEGKEILLEVDVKYGEQFINLIEIFPLKTWIYLVIVGAFILIIIILIITFIIMYLKWAEIKKALLNRGSIQMIANQQDELEEQVLEIEELEKRKQELKKQNKLIKKLKDKKSHLNILMPYEEDQSVTRLYGTNDDIYSDMIGFVKDENFPQEDGYIGRQQTSLYTPGLELRSGRNSPALQAYALNLQAKLDDYESQNARKISPGLDQPDKRQKILIEIPVIEEGTLNQQITEYFINSKPVTIDFSSMHSNDPQLQGINWGVCGPPATIGLAQQGVTSPPKEILNLQKRQEQLISRTSTGYTKSQSWVSFKSSSSSLERPFSSQGYEASFPIDFDQFTNSSSNLTNQNTLPNGQRSTKHYNSERPPSISDIGEHCFISQPLGSLFIVETSHSTPSDFKKVRSLGKGSYGSTYLVERLADQNQYCLKVIHIAMLTAKEQRDAVSEACILAQLDSDYIVRYYDSFLDGANLYIVMEFAEEGTLSDLLNKKKEQENPFTEDEIWRFFFELALGLHHIHSKKMIHRDVKTANVFLGKGYQVKIGDLGVAKLLETQSFAKTMVGTPYYIAPELIRGTPYTSKIDVWALGCILYELLTLTRPFDANNQAALLHRIISETPQQIPEHPQIIIGEEEDNGTSHRDRSKDKNKTEDGQKQEKKVFTSITYSETLRKLPFLLLTKESSDRPNLSKVFQLEDIIEKAQQYGYELPGKKSKTKKQAKEDQEQDQQQTADSEQQQNQPQAENSNSEQQNQQQSQKKISTLKKQGTSKKKLNNQQLDDTNFDQGTLKQTQDTNDMTMMNDQTFKTIETIENTIPERNKDDKKEIASFNKVENKKETNTDKKINDQKQAIDKKDIVVDNKKIIDKKQNTAKDANIDKKQDNEKKVINVKEMNVIKDTNVDKKLNDKKDIIVDKKLNDKKDIIVDKKANIEKNTNNANEANDKKDINIGKVANIEKKANEIKPENVENQPKVVKDPNVTKETNTAKDQQVAQTTNIENKGKVMNKIKSKKQMAQMNSRKSIKAEQKDDEEESEDEESEEEDSEEEESDEEEEDDEDYEDDDEEQEEEDDDDDEEDEEEEEQEEDEEEDNAQSEGISSQPKTPLSLDSVQSNPNSQRLEGSEDERLDSDKKDKDGQKRIYGKVEDLSKVGVKSDGQTQDEQQKKKGEPRWDSSRTIRQQNNSLGKTDSKSNLFQTSKVEENEFNTFTAYKLDNKETEKEEEEEIFDGQQEDGEQLVNPRFAFLKRKKTVYGVIPSKPRKPTKWIVTDNTLQPIEDPKRVRRGSNDLSSPSSSTFQQSQSASKSSLAQKQKAKTSVQKKKLPQQFQFPRYDIVAPKSNVTHMSYQTPGTQRGVRSNLPVQSNSPDLLNTSQYPSDQQQSQQQLQQSITDQSQDGQLNSSQFPNPLSIPSNSFSPGLSISGTPGLSIRPQRMKVDIKQPVLEMTRGSTQNVGNRDLNNNTLDQNSKSRGGTSGKQGTAKFDSLKTTQGNQSSLDKSQSPSQPYSRGKQSSQLPHSQLSIQQTQSSPSNQSVDINDAGYGFEDEPPQISKFNPKRNTAADKGTIVSTSINIPSQTQQQQAQQSYSQQPISPKISHPTGSVITNQLKQPKVNQTISTSSVSSNQIAGGNKYNTQDNKTMFGKAGKSNQDGIGKDQIDYPVRSSYEGLNSDKQKEGELDKKMKPSGVGVRFAVDYNNINSQLSNAEKDNESVKQIENYLADSRRINQMTNQIMGSKNQQGRQNNLETPKERLRFQGSIYDTHQNNKNTNIDNDEDIDNEIDYNSTIVGTQWRNDTYEQKFNSKVDDNKPIGTTAKKQQLSQSIDPNTQSSSESKSSGSKWQDDDWISPHQTGNKYEDEYNREFIDDEELNKEGKDASQYIFHPLQLGNAGKGGIQDELDNEFDSWREEKTPHRVTEYASVKSNVTKNTNTNTNTNTRIGRGIGRGGAGIDKGKFTSAINTKKDKPEEVGVQDEKSKIMRAKLKATSIPIKPNSTLLQQRNKDILLHTTEFDDQQDDMQNTNIILGHQPDLADNADPVYVSAPLRTITKMANSRLQNQTQQQQTQPKQPLRTSQTTKQTSQQQSSTTQPSGFKGSKVISSSNASHSTSQGNRGSQASPQPSQAPKSKTVSSNASHSTQPQRPIGANPHLTPYSPNDPPKPFSAYKNNNLAAISAERRASLGKGRGTVVNSNANVKKKDIQVFESEENDDEFFKDEIEESGRVGWG
ncbi:MAG: putative MAP kinase kinase family domain protein [Streblomastix strix]|uniref:non-specific serine/threonine protein kinase n=1 Tax=Streblomastix strix TaxID=222440 RepID=A0A5J4X8E9_9EUKA|nr:MAG: putative MAP kinase kinase family domain protein [Streblomastix strix]